MDRDEYFAFRRQQQENDARARADEARARAQDAHDRNIRAQLQRDQQARWDHDSSLRAQYDRIQETNDRIRNERSASIRHQLEDHRHAQIRHYTNQIYGTNPHATTDPGRFPHSVDKGHWWQIWKR